MFGSKHLLFAYCLGVFGLVLAVSALGGVLPLPRLLMFLAGLLILWTSALFGPLCYLWEKGLPAANGVAEPSGRP
jgi:hypothetical protein